MLVSNQESLQGNALCESPSSHGRHVDVVIVGGSLGALMIAGQLKHQMPDLSVLVVGPRPEQEKRPIVGESLLEPPTMFFRRIGFGEYLEREHTIKQGLSFYYKLYDDDDDSNRRYTVHTPELLHIQSRQLHRPRFDIDLRRHVEGMGVGFLVGRAEDVELGKGGALHRLHVRVADRECVLTCRWIVDATGRNRWLGRRVTKYMRPETRQRSCFWFRLADFEPFSDHIRISMRRPLKYTLWETTHHFMGHGYWVWCIPMQSPCHRTMISLGLTYRSDLFTRPMKSIADFLAVVDCEHPALGEMVRSGSIVDMHTYGNYLYSAERIYSEDGWFLTADAARSVDPLYSTGLTMNVIQIEQIADIISRQRSGGISTAAIDDLQQLWQLMNDQTQDEITTLYEAMGDPFQACMRRYWSNITYFNLLLPMWWNGVFRDEKAARVLHFVLAQGTAMQASAIKFCEQASRRLGNNLSQADYDRAVDFDWLLNPHWDCPPSDVPYYFSRVLYKRAVLRWKLLKMERYRHFLSQVPAVTLELLLSRIMPGVLRLALPHLFAGTRPAASARDGRANAQTSQSY